MRKNLGKIFLLLLINLKLFATSYEWSATINKQEAYINEPIYLKYVCTFSDDAKFNHIDFHIEGDYEKYSIKNLSESQNLLDGKKVKIYEFIAYAKVEGKIDFAFDAIMKKTTKEIVEESIIGRDNVKAREFTKETYKQKTLSINIKDTPNLLVGDFELEVKKSEPKAKAYEPYHIELKIKGSGNFELIKPFVFDIEGVKVFAEDIVLKQELTQDGFKGEWSQKFAFVGERDFKIPDIKIEYFSLKEAKPKSLEMSQIDVKVSEGYKKEELLDKTSNNAFVWDKTYIYYLAAFIFGYLVAKMDFKRLFIKQKASKNEFSQKIDSIKSLDEFMVYLALLNDKKFDTIIQDIESKKITTLKGAKEQLLLKI